MPLRAAFFALIISLMTGIATADSCAADTSSHEKILASKSSAESAEKGQPLSHNEFIKQATNGAADGHCITATATGAAITCSLQALTGTLDANGLKMNSSAENEAGSWRVQVTGIGRETLSPIAPGKVTVDGSLARLIRPDIVEEISTSADGVRQDFIILKKPPGSGELCVSLRLDGTTITEVADDHLSFRLASGRQLTWRGLAVTDATGKKLAARFTDTRGTLAMAVNDESAMYPVRIDPVFTDVDWLSMGGFTGTNGDVYALFWYNLQLCVAGKFTYSGSTQANNIVLWNGSRWQALGTGEMNGVDSAVSALAVSGNNLYVGGLFSYAGGSPANNIAKWDGHTWSALKSQDDEQKNGVDNTVTALAVSGSDLYVGGWFTNAGGSPANYVAKWDGHTWSDLKSQDDEKKNGVDSTVSALAVSGNNLYVGGLFSYAGGSLANNIAKWDGHTWSALKSQDDEQKNGVNSNVVALAVSGSDLYVGGWFSYAGDRPASGIAKWDGHTWLALKSQDDEQKNGVDGMVNALAVSGSNLYVGGSFTSAGGNPANNIAKWDGHTWLALKSQDDEQKNGLNNEVRTLAVSGSDMYVGGWFNKAGGSHINHIAKWDGNRWLVLMSKSDEQKNGVDDIVSAMAVSGSDLYVGGLFTYAGGVPANHIAKWDGNVWSALKSQNDDSKNGVDNDVTALAVSGSDLYVGGWFTNAGGSSANNIAKWDGNAWSALKSQNDDQKNGVDYGVSALAVSGRDLYVGGYFTNAGGSPANYVAKWNGNTWSPLKSLGEDQKNGIDRDDNYGYSVSALAVSGSNLYVGGYFSNAGGSSANNIAKWDGYTWSSLKSQDDEQGNGVDGNGVTVLALSGSNLYVGGYFNNAGGSPANHIAKWDGQSWSALKSQDDDSKIGVDYTVNALAVSGSDLYVGEELNYDGGNPASLVIKWDGIEWSTLGSGANDNIYALAILGNNLYVGGAFIAAGSKVSPYVALAAINGLISVSDTSFTIKESSKATCTLTLPLAPEPGTRIDITIKPRRPADVSASKTTISFNHDDWSPKSFDITAINDGVDDGTIDSIIDVALAFSSDSRFKNYDPDDINVKTIDSEPSLADIPTQTLDEDAASCDVVLTGIRGGDMINPNGNISISAISSITAVASDESIFSKITNIDYTSPMTTTTLHLKPNKNANGNTTITVTAKTTTNTIITRQFSVTVNSINDAPILDGPDLVLPNVQGRPLTDVKITTGGLETDNQGTEIAGLIVGLITDIDPSPKGIAVTGFTNEKQGTWYYCTDFKVNNVNNNWLTIENVSESHALLISDDAGVRVRFVPTGAWNGKAEIKYRAWDRSSGAMGDYVTINNTGGTSAFSINSAISSVKISGTAAPEITMHTSTVTWTEGDPAITIDNGVTVTDTDSTTFNGGTLTVFIKPSRMGDLLKIKDGVEASHPELLQDGIDKTKWSASLTDTSTVENVQTWLRHLTYENIGDNPGEDPEAPENRIITITINDGPVTSLPAMYTVIVDPIDDPPTLEPLTLTLVPGLTVSDQLIAHDPEDPDGHFLLFSCANKTNKGEATVTPTGQLTYINTTLDGQDDSFQVSVTTGKKTTQENTSVEKTATATVTVRVTAPDDTESKKTFTTIPPMRGHSGQLISYTPGVIGFKSGLHFQLKPPPQIASTRNDIESAFQFDSTTGTLTITLPVVPDGEYLRCGILATDAEHNSAYQQILIKITSGDNG